MNFKKKLFLAIFIPSILICGGLLVYVHSKASSSLQSEFIQRYENFNGVLARAIVQIEENTSLSMLNAGRLLQRHEAEYPGIGTPGLKKLSSDIGAADVFVANQDGKIVRATNDVVDEAPNLLAACSGRGRLLGTAHGRAYDSTPVVRGSSDGTAYKYLIVPNHAGNRFLEVAYRADFIGKTLLDAVKGDPGILSVGLYAADGTSLGEYGPATGAAEGKGAPLKWNGKEGVDFSGDRAVFTKVVPLSEANCCECKVLKAQNPHGYAYILRTSVSATVLAASLGHLRTALGAASVLAAGFAFVLSLLISYLLVARIKKLRKAIDGISSSSEVKIRVPEEGADEIGALGSAFNRMLDRIENSHAKFLRNEKAKLTHRMTSQVAQEIRSPLAAFNVLEADLSGLPQSAVQLFRTAVNRVRDIAGTLLSQRPELEDASEAPKKDVPGVKLLSSLLEPIVSEVRSTARSGVTIECGLDAKSYGWFISVGASEFQRTISALIQHAVDSLQGPGRVRIELSRIDHDLLITISDDGATWDRDEPADDTESVIRQARKSLEVWGGKLEVKSNAEVGTERRIVLRMAEAPFWSVDRIEIPNGSTIAVVDDDVSIHGVWQRTFETHLLEKNECELVCFSTTEAFAEWLAANPKRNRRTFCFIAYEFPNGVENGLQLIERLSIQSRSFLVTNRFEERSVLEVCARLRVRMIPKTMLGFVPIETSLEWRSRDTIASQPTTLEI
jgi:signal transduction histidine kinase